MRKRPQAGALGRGGGGGAETRGRGRVPSWLWAEVSFSDPVRGSRCRPHKGTPIPMWAWGSSRGN